VQSLKEMRVKHDCLKDTVRILQSLRDDIVIIEDNNLQVSLFNKLGSKNGLKIIVDRLYEKVINDQNITEFFKATLLEMQKTKMVYYLTSALGGSLVWVGQSMKSAH
jgi:hypothetical protein